MEAVTKRPHWQVPLPLHSSLTSISWCSSQSSPADLDKRNEVTSYHDHSHRDEQHQTSYSHHIIQSEGSSKRAEV